jgi:hypothetical protein
MSIVIYSSVELIAALSVLSSQCSIVLCNCLSDIWMPCFKLFSCWFTSSLALLIVYNASYSIVLKTLIGGGEVTRSVAEICFLFEEELAAYKIGYIRLCLILDCNRASLASSEVFGAPLETALIRSTCDTWGYLPDFFVSSHIFLSVKRTLAVKVWAN